MMGREVKLAFGVSQRARVTELNIGHRDNMKHPIHDLAYR
jgi:hypothetical protein